MKRIILFLVTNLAIMLVLGLFLNILASFFGISPNSIPGLLMMAAVFGMGGSFISLCLSKWMAKRATGAKIIERPTHETESRLLQTVQRQAKMLNIGMPEVAIYPSPDINAFATGMDRDHALVAVSSGLLQKLSPDEQEAVLGHELSHVANGDMVTLALIQGVVNTFVIFFSRIIGQFVNQLLSGNRGNEHRADTGIGYFISSMIAEIVLGFLASFIVFWFSRQREYRADAGGAEVAGRDKMIAALRRLKAAQDNRQAEGLPKELVAFGIAERSGMMRFLTSHPPLEDRIERLLRARN